MDIALVKRRFAEHHGIAGLAQRQRKVLQRLLDNGDGGFMGGFNAEKYMKLTGASKATATRDLGEMVKRGRLWTTGVGKALCYQAMRALNCEMEAVGAGLGRPVGKLWLAA